MHVKGSESRRSKSLVNDMEARAVAHLCVYLRERLALSGDKGSLHSRVGVISPYAQQTSQIRRQLRERPADEATRAALTAIEVATVDAYQGREKDYIIVSCVRAGQGGGIGFLKDAARLNVMITRARLGLYILGDAETLRSDPMWCALLDDAKVSAYSDLDKIHTHARILSRNHVRAQIQIYAHTHRHIHTHAN
jgi:superfamily I DNA and/or RNA helicase